MNLYHFSKHLTYKIFLMSILLLTSGVIEAQQQAKALKNCFTDTAGFPPEFRKLETELRKNLVENILPFWMNKMTDHENGGFYGRIDWKNTLYKDAVKGGILNARILWTFSSAFRVLKDSSYLKTATRARDYILANFIDKQYGGAYLSLDYKAQPQDTRKQVYTQSFFIYSLSEYYLATGDPEALSAAKDIYSLVEKYSLDKENNGYFEVFSREWKQLSDKIIGEKSAHDKKGMNTHLHLMEAYANLYRAWPDPVVEKSLRNLVDLFYNQIVDKQTFHLVYFSDEKWNPTSPVESYGHDIEASWLLVEAALTLKDPDLTGKIEKLSLQMVKAAAEGIRSDGSMINERDKNSGHTDNNSDWWNQAETVVGFVNAFQLTGDKAYLVTAVNNWNYISRNMVDYDEGEWFNSISDAGVYSKLDKAGYWKCPYHNSRMCMEILRRAAELN